MANEKVISTQALIEKFKQALAEKWGYIWGTKGEPWTAAKQAELEKTTDADRANSRKYGSKWIGHKVADCSGLFSWAFKQLGGYMYHGSDTMFRKYCTRTGELKNGKRTDGQPLLPGTAVFVFNGKKYSHVGLYIGNGTVIEAMGAKNGVTTSKITATKWTNWGELKGVDYSNETQEPTPTPEPKPSTKPTLRRGSKGPYVIELQTDLVALGYGIGPCGIDGDYGRATQAAVEKFQLDHKLTVDGICGPKTWAAIDQAMAEKQNAPAPEITYTVTIKGLSLDEADSLVMKYQNATASAEGSDR